MAPRLAATAAFDEAEDASPQSARQYHDHWRRLIDLEWAEEERSVTERLESWSLGRLEREGLCLTGLHHRATGRYYDRLLLRFDTESYMSAGRDQPHRRHEFQVGDAVVMARQESGGQALKGELVELSADTIAVAVSEAQAHAVDMHGDGAWRMDRVANRTAYSRTAAALAELCGAEWAGAGVVRKLVMEEGHIGRRQPQAAQLRPWVGEAEDGELLRGTEALLNPSQSDAVCAAFRASLSAIQGPPGTGKTAAACLLLALAARNLNGSVGPLLATADSNAAADEMLSALLRLGVRAVRVGQPSRTEASSRPLFEASLAVKAEEHPDTVHIAHTRARLGEQAAAVRAAEGRAAQGVQGIGHEEAARAVRRGWAELKRREEVVAQEVLMTHEVVVSTLVGCGSAAMRELSFALVVVDEASQATEARCALALARARGAVVLVGDQKQLPPTVRSKEARAAGLDASLFARLAASGQLPPSLLATQYRMHPLIRAWPSSYFYGGRLVDAPEAVARVPPAALPAPVLFCDIAAGRDEAAPGGASKLNRAEVAAAVSAVRRLRCELPATSICVLAPYRGQVTAIRRGLARAGLRAVEVATVDGFQGREQEVVVFSCVRANDEGRLGFLADPRRLNVALTRARRGLVVLGHRATLRHDPAWGSWLGFVDEHGLEGAVPAVGSPRGSPLPSGSEEAAAGSVAAGIRRGLGMGLVG